MKKLLISSLIAFGLVAQVASATTITLSAAVGGLATGSTKLSFDSLTSGSHATVTLSGATISFGGNAQVAKGNSSVYAAPYISGSNGLGFGNALGQDTTSYLSTGTGSITLDFSGVTEKYFGLLWGSVDTYNYVKFYNAGSLVGSFSGADVNAAAHGDQGIYGTFTWISRTVVSASTRSFSPAPATPSSSTTLPSTSPPPCRTASRPLVCSASPSRASPASVVAAKLSLCSAS
jgi:hypothetical protein